VEEAFFTTDRGELIVSGDLSKVAVLTIVWRGVSYPSSARPVMTVSFHKFGDFFPGAYVCASLRQQDVDTKKVKYYSVDFPLAAGIDDKSYQRIFEPVHLPIRLCAFQSTMCLHCYRAWCG